ncbi:uncharacterized protein LOC142231555 [Haematobia irritans]|uniref:uncharacterized protein LOC142231555 n=1 Tax=Haematobia irritans TaxID=7368 RepID=UPI003F500E36
MAGQKSLAATTVILVIISFMVSRNYAYGVAEPLMLELAKHYKHLGRTSTCVADHYHETGIQHGIEHVMDESLRYIKQHIDQASNDEQYFQLISFVLKTANSYAARVHQKCTNVPENFTPRNTPSIGLGLSVTSLMFVRIGHMLECIAHHGNSAVLDSVPLYIAKIVIGIAYDKGHSNLDIIYRYNKALEYDLGALLPGCRL